jgi:transmembrane regulatory protein ToxS
MNSKVIIGLLVACVVVTVGIYFLPAYKLHKTITSNEWKNVLVMLFSDQNSQDVRSENEMPTLDKVEVFSNTRYLPDGIFIKVTHMKVFRSDNADDSAPPSTVEFTESGKWELHRNYLFLKDTEISNVPTERSLDLTKEQVSDLRTRLLMTEQQSSRVDIINERSLLLTNLNEDSQLLHAN